MDRYTGSIKYGILEVGKNDAGSENKDRSRLIAAAMQKIACDLTVENVQFVNVITGEIYPASVDVLDGVVVRVRRAGETTSQKSARVYDGGGRYLVPGYFDTHMHVESTMMIPENFARAVVVCGTTSVIADPHEIGNVMGIDGVRFMLDNAKRAMIRMYCVVPLLRTVGGRRRGKRRKLRRRRNCDASAGRRRAGRGRGHGLCRRD